MTTNEADPKLFSDIQRYGKFDANGCFSCGTCTLSCKLTSDLSSFPRRLMRYVHFGLRGELQGSLEPWLCYYCGDCSEACPQKADPAESMMTLRRYLTAQYDWTGLSRKIYRSTIWHLGVLLAVGAGVLGLGYLIHKPAAIDWLQGVLGADLFASHPCLPALKAFDWLVVGLMALLVLSNAVRMYWFTIGRSGLKVPGAAYLTELRTLFYQGVSQIGFRRCADNDRRWKSHLALASGCLLMFALVFLALDWFQTDKLLPIYHPQRWLGYLATGAILFGAGDTLLGRIRRREPMHSSSQLDDWVLPVLLLLTALTGILIHVLRYLDLSLWSADLYAAHMVVVVPMLLVEIPFGKWAHMFYRPLAVYFEALKQRALAASLATAAVPQPAQKVA
jgi:ferredoxin